MTQEQGVRNGGLQARNPLGRVRVDGKQFAIADRRFRFHGVTYGTFRPRDDGARYPKRDQVKNDFMSISEAGFTVVRTYTVPPDDVVDLAADWDLHLLSDVFYPDWRYLVGVGRRQKRRIAKQAAASVRRAARNLAGVEHVMALSLGNEVPADVLRWVGTDTVADVIRELVDVVHEEDPDVLVTYGNYPTAEYLPLEDLDFLMFNVYLERREDFRRYLTRLHHLAGDRPLVLSELGQDAGTDAAGERQQADTLDWQLETALERGVAGTCVFSWTDEWCVGDQDVEDWHFGLTRADRSPRAALESVQWWNGRTIADLDHEWPSMSVVVCAYNAEATIDECLRHACALDYPDLEIVVVDDGSTDRTAEVAAGHPRARLLTIPHAGLSVARNEGLRAAKGEIVAYLDSDAYPTPEWPYYLALSFDAPDVAGGGGPNVPPATDPLGAAQVAQAPGGPVHVLVTDNRAEHVPGCNMAFWREALLEVGGFDPVYTSAGDDVDLCWRILDHRYQIGFHPAALVWHHRRSGLRTYLRQQRGYGRSEALVEARHPSRFTSTGSARWQGRIYNSFAPSVTRQRVYRGVYGAAAYQSVYRAGGYGLDLAHQVGVPLAVGTLALVPLALLWTAALLVPALALAFLGTLFGIDVSRAKPPRRLTSGRRRFRVGVAVLHVLQPVVRTWGRLRARRGARLGPGRAIGIHGPVNRVGRGVMLVPQDRSRERLVEAVIDGLRRTGLRLLGPTGWEDYDARVICSTFVMGELVSSAYPVGYVQLRVRRRLRAVPLAFALPGVVALTMIGPVAAALGSAFVVAELVRGLVVTPRRVRRHIAGAGTPS
jgi:glycosyltransferase involved in cell wall biosynthesis